MMKLTNIDEVDNLKLNSDEFDKYKGLMKNKRKAIQNRTGI